MTDALLVRGIELRYLLTMILARAAHPSTVADLIETLEYQGFRPVGRASKAVSDALRWEIGHGRVRRLARGRYGPGAMPRSTEQHIHHRVLELRRRAETLTGAADDAFWDAAAD